MSATTAAAADNMAAGYSSSDSEDSLMDTPPQPQQPSDLSLLGVWRGTLASMRSSPACNHSAGGGRIALCAAFLGLVAGIGLMLVLSGEWRTQIGLYMVAMASFHGLEFAWTAICHPAKLSAQAFLLDHSRAYHIALVAGLAEFFIELWLVPGLKSPSLSIVMWLGLLIVAAGQFVRTLAMFTAAANFTHIVADTRAPDHVLVTHGVYSLCRHPSYAGWFWWSVGTQVLLGNPVCTIAYAVASFTFFRARINYEERAMLGFFGEAYVQYQKRVPSGVPFIKGFLLQ